MHGVVESLNLVTARKSIRIAKFAYDYATKHGKKTVMVMPNLYVNILVNIAGGLVGGAGLVLINLDCLHLFNL